MFSCVQPLFLRCLRATVTYDLKGLNAIRAHPLLVRERILGIRQPPRVGVGHVQIRTPWLRATLVRAVGGWSAAPRIPKIRDGAKQTVNERGDSQWIQNKRQNIEIRQGQHRRRFGKECGCAAKPLCRTGQTRPPKTFRWIKTYSLRTIKIRLNRRRPLKVNDVQGWQRKARRTGMPVRPASLQLQGKVCKV